MLFSAGFVCCCASSSRSVDFVFFYSQVVLNLAKSVMVALELFLWQRVTVDNCLISHQVV